MKKSKKQKNKTQSEELKWYTFDEVFKDLSKNKDFQKGYQEELARLQVVK
jgi:hypothetical protein